MQRNPYWPLNAPRFLRTDIPSFFFLAAVRRRPRFKFRGADGKLATEPSRETGYQTDSSGRVATCASVLKDAQTVQIRISTSFYLRPSFTDPIPRFDRPFPDVVTDSLRVPP
jgi:hypothetical protein